MTKFLKKKLLTHFGTSCRELLSLRQILNHHHSFCQSFLSRVHALFLGFRVEGVFFCCFFNTGFALNAPTLTLEYVSNPGAENPSFRLCARHVTLLESSRGATAGSRFKSEQSSKGVRVFAVTRHFCMNQQFIHDHCVRNYFAPNTSFWTEAQDDGM